MNNRASAAAPLRNVSAERLFLGALVLSGHSYWSVQDHVRSDHFSVPLHRDIFSAVADIAQGSGKVSVTLVAARLPEEAEGADGDPVTPREYLAVLVDAAQEAEISALDLADQIAELASRRQVIAIADQMAKAARRGEKSAIDISSEAELALLDVMQVSAPKRPRSIKDFASQLLHGAKVAKETNRPPGCHTGINPIDEILGLILPSDAGFILGVQGDGKSALAAQIGVHVAQSGPVLMIQMEMTGEQIAARELAAASGVSVRDIHEGSFQWGEWDALQEAERNIGASFYILDAGKLTLRQIRAHAMTMKRTVGLRMLIIDQLNKIKAEGRTRDKFERLEEITTEIKNLAKELGVPIVTLAQRTRTAQRRDDPTPSVMDAESPSLEHNADWILAVWRMENYLMQNRPSKKAGGEEKEKWEHEIARARGLAEVICLKRRRGQAFEQRQLKWEGGLTRFSEIS